jgi:hypothetical protein
MSVMVESFRGGGMLGKATPAADARQLFVRGESGQDYCTNAVRSRSPL